MCISNGTVWHFFLLVQWNIASFKNSVHIVAGHYICVSGKIINIPILYWEHEIDKTNVIANANQMKVFDP